MLTGSAVDKFDIEKSFYTLHCERVVMLADIRFAPRSYLKRFCNGYGLGTNSE